MDTDTFAWHYPQDSGMPLPAPTPQATAQWAVNELLAVQGTIIAHPRDLAALQATALGQRVVPGSSAIGLPQAGTVWLTGGAA